jgi:hypothetical protein
MSKKIIKVIELESIFTIEVSGKFYARIQQMLLGMANQKTPEEFMKALESIKTDEEAKSEYEYNLHTIMSLVYEMDTQAELQGKIKDHEIDEPDSEDDSKNPD